MTTLSHPSHPLPSARGLSLQTWFKGLALLSGLLGFASFCGLTVLFYEGSLDAAGMLEALSELDPAAGRIPLPLILASLLFVGAALGRWQHQQMWRMEQRGRELLQAGRPEAAIRDLEVAASCGNETQRMRSLHGLALAWLRMGDIERALSFASRSGEPAAMALVLALDGELEQARTWVQEVERPIFGKTDPALLAQAVIFCREGLYVLAVKRIQRAAREHVPVMDVGAVGVIHAFARSRLGGQLVPLKPGCVLPEKPGRGSGYEYLGQAWPELAAFLRGEDAPAVAREA